MRIPLLTVACALALACAPDAALACSGADSSRLDRRAEAAAITCLVNEQRAGARLAPLRRSAALGRIARRRLGLMLRCGGLSHAPCGRPLRRDAGPYRGRFRAWGVGENLQWRRGRTITPRAVVANWMASASHRANIMSPHWRHVGVGIRHGVRMRGSRGSVWVQWFGRRVTGRRSGR